MRTSSETSKDISPVIKTYLESTITKSIKLEDLNYLQSMRKSMSSAEHRIYDYIESCIKQKRFTVS